MPIYEYQCAQCGKIQEALQKISDKPLTKCTHCAGKLHKLISHSAFHLKGTGWYVTDYANKNQNKNTKTETNATTTTKDATGTDTSSNTDKTKNANNSND